MKKIYLILKYVSPINRIAESTIYERVFCYTYKCFIFKHKLFSLESLEVTQIHVYDYFIFNHPSADSVAIQNLLTIQNNEKYEEL